MRFLIIGGFAKSLLNFRGPLLRELVARGHEVHAAAPGLRRGSVESRELRQMGVTPHDVPMNRTGLSPLADLKLVFSLIHLNRRVRPDMVMGYTIKPVIWGLLAAKLAGVPQRVALITGLGYAFTGNARGKRAIVRRVARSLYGLAMRCATLVFFQNPDDRTDFARWGLLPRKLAVEVVNGSGVDTAKFAPVRFPDGSLRFLLIARLLGDKGIREYAAAAARLRTRWPDAEFHLVGPLDPNPDAIAEDEVRSWCVAGDLVWQGVLEDVRPAIAASHIFVLPSSYREGTPRTILEAMSMGRPVITTDAPGCRETVENGVNGFLVPIRDTDALVEAMSQFLANPGLVLVSGAAARRRAVEIYDVQKVNATMIAAMGL